MTKIIKKIFVFALSAFFFSISAHADNSRYIDHQGHNVDSLEIAVAEWTADKTAKASDEELLQLVYDWHDLMLGYENVNLETSLYYGRKVFNTSSRKGWKAMTWASAKVIGQYFWAKEQYDSAKWAVAESQGVVFFPAAGSRFDTEIWKTGSYGNYWSSAPWYYDNAQVALFDCQYTFFNFMETLRWEGCAIRLVENVTE